MKTWNKPNIEELNILETETSDFSEVPIVGAERLRDFIYSNAQTPYQIDQLFHIYHNRGYLLVSDLDNLS